MSLCGHKLHSSQRRVGLSSFIPPDVISNKFTNKFLFYNFRCGFKIVELNGEKQNDLRKNKEKERSKESLRKMEMEKRKRYSMQIF